MAWAPVVAMGLQFVGTLAGGRANANALKMQARVSSEQALADEAAQRRDLAALRGSNAAAIAESGLSSDGSSAAFADQQATLAELDALNIRYRGQVRSQGLLAEAKAAKSNANLLAGGQLLAGASDLYTRRRTMPGAS